MILALRTSSPTCYMALIGKETIAQKEWLAERRLSKELLGQLESFLHENNSSFEKLTGLAVFRGPGSYTGLRIGINVMNTLAYGLSIPIVGESGEEWITQGQKHLGQKKNDQIVIPEYGGLPNISVTKK